MNQKVRATRVRGSARGDGASSTRERILIEASELFARDGYVNTSTRDIADAVGIRQPSLFYHFQTKAEIFGELLSRDLRLALDQLNAVVADASEDSVAAKLYAYMVLDADAIVRGQPTIVGLYDRRLLGEPEFQEQWKMRTTLHVRTEELVRAGVQGGEFLAEPDPAFVREAITAITLNAAQRKLEGSSTVGGDDLAMFIVRSIIREPERLADVRRRGTALAASLSDRWA